MSVKQKNAANARKEAMKTVYVARLVDNPTSPRKTRIMANVIRGKNVDYAMNVLKYSHREASEKLLKLLKSAVANWQVKNEDKRLEDIESARIVWNKGYRKMSLIKMIVAIAVLATILVGWIVPTVTIQNAGPLPLYIALGIAAAGILIIVGFGFIQKIHTGQHKSVRFLLWRRCSHSFFRRGFLFNFFQNGFKRFDLQRRQFFRHNLFEFWKQAQTL